MLTFFLSLLLSLLTTAFIVRRSRRHGGAMLDTDLDGAQKFHEKPVPRVGGVGVYLGLWVALGVTYIYRAEYVGFVGGLLACASLVFFAGLWEDVRKSLSAHYRLLISLAVAALAFGWLGIRLGRLDIPFMPFIDEWLQWWPLALVLTMVAVAGLVNAINIIDGFNGLASAVSLFYFMGLTYVAWKVGDVQLVTLCLAMLGGILGFFLLNWPKGLIFLGDGGAYLVGFMLAMVSLLLVQRHSAVSPWFPLLLILYPICETLFSMYRRVVLHGKSASIADGIHFHSLIYRRIVRWVAGHDEAKKIVLRNSMTSPYLWLLSSLSVIPAVLFWQKTGVLMGFMALFVVSYVWLYWRIVRFRTPKIFNVGGFARKSPENQ